MIKIYEEPICERNTKAKGGGRKEGRGGEGEGEREYLLDSSKPVFL
jgi:hypothetical protein